MNPPDWDYSLNWCDLAPDLEVAYITRAFEQAGEVCRPYSDARVNQALYYLVSHASEKMFLLFDEGVSPSARRRCLLGMYEVYARVFAPRCSPHLGHLGEAGANPLNRVCYMWWDILPIYGQPDEPARREDGEAILDVMARTLDLDSDACREGALHGLGHRKRTYPARVEATIGRFLQAHPDLRPELREYAEHARIGSVL